MEKLLPRFLITPALAGGLFFVASAPAEACPIDFIYDNILIDTPFTSTTREEFHQMVDFICDLRCS